MLMSVFKENNQLQRAFMFYIKDQNKEHQEMIEKFLHQMKIDPIPNTEQYHFWHLWKDPSCQMSRKKFDKAFRQYFTELPGKK